MGSLCTSVGHHIGSMETGGRCCVLELLACFVVIMIACSVAGVLVVVSIRRSAGRFHLRKPGSPPLL
jgi:hypothetical protein